MTHLLKMMLEELQRRNYSEATTRCYIRTVEDFAKRFKRSPDRLVLNTFANTKLSCSRRSCRPAPLRNVWRLCGFSTSRLSRDPGASPRLPTRNKDFTYQRSSARNKSHDSSTQLRLPTIALC